MSDKKDSHGFDVKRHAAKLSLIFILLSSPFFYLAYSEFKRDILLWNENVVTSAEVEGVVKIRKTFCLSPKLSFSVKGSTYYSAGYKRCLDKKDILEKSYKVMYSRDNPSLAKEYYPGSMLFWEFFQVAIVYSLFAVFFLGYGVLGRKSIEKYYRQRMKIS